MRQKLQRITGFIDRLNDRVGEAVSWLTTVLVVLVCFDVIIRYIFSDTQAWIMELEWHLFSLIFLFGAAYGLLHDRHVRVDLFYTRFSPRDQALVNLLGSVLFLIPWCVLLIVFSFGYAAGSYKIGEISPDPGGLPARYLIKFAITTGIFLLLLQAVSQALKSWLIYRNTYDETNPNASAD